MSDGLLYGIGLVAGVPIGVVCACVALRIEKWWDNR